MLQEVWVLLEAEDGEIKEASLEVMTEVKKLMRGLGTKLVAISSLNNEAARDTIKLMGVATAYLPAEGAEVPAPAAVAETVSKMIASEQPVAVFAAETIQGHEIMSRISVALKLPYVPDCVGMSKASDGRLAVEKFSYNDRVSNIMSVVKEETLLVGVRPGLFNVKKEAKPAKVEEQSIAYSAAEGSAKILEFIKADPRTVDICDAEIMVVGGRGILTDENWENLRQLADLMGAAVGGTRIARDKGWIGLDRQIGQTGKTVIPKMLLSFGVSGATQHTFGMKESKFIIAVNNDKTAPIFKLADVSVIADAEETILQLISKLKEAKGIKDDAPQQETKAE